MTTTPKGTPRSIWDRLDIDSECMPRSAAVVLEEAFQSLQSALAAAEQEVERLKELHDMQMAAISTATFANTDASRKEATIDRANPYWTQPYLDVVTAIAREISQRERAEAAELRASQAEELVEHWKHCHGVTADALEQAQAAASASAKDAERYRWFRARISAIADERGRQEFVFPELSDSRVNLMKGSVAGHFDDAIDRALSDQPKSEGDSNG